MSIAQPLSAEQLDEFQQMLGGDQKLGNEQAADDTVWPDPISFDDISLLPDFPVETLSGVGREMVAEVSAVAQVDPGLTGSLYLAVISACLGGRIDIDLKSHKEPVNIYAASALPSGERKSYVESTLSKPIYDYQALAQDSVRDAIREADNRRKILETRLAKYQKQAAACEDHLERLNLQRQAATIAKELEDDPAPASPVYVVDDITTEKLGALMAANNETMSILSAEGGIFKLIDGLYNNGEGGNIDLYLKAHAGDPWASHRIGRESISMRKPSLTMGLAIQPDVLDEIGRNKHFRGRGLLARFLFTICKSHVGYRTRQTQSLPDALLSAYDRHIVELIDDKNRITLLLSDDGHKIWNTFYDDIEHDMRPGGDLESIKDWGSKLPGAVARIAGLLHLAALGKNGKDHPISVNIVTASCVLGTYFREHALAAFSQMQEDARITTAKKILSYLERIQPHRFKGRDVLRHVFFKNGTMDDATPGLEMLIEREYIRQAAGEYSGKGRPESMAYDVNPKIFKNQKP